MNLPSPDVRLTLTSLSYREWEGLPKEWMFQDLRLGELNLVVGRNATGKTRLLAVVASLAGLISGLHQRLFASGHWEAKFADSSGTTWSYELKLEKGRVQCERLLVAGNVLLDAKEDGTGEIFSVQMGVQLATKVPTDRLLMLAKQDAAQHPFLEPMIEWARQVYQLRFGSSMAKENMYLITNEPPNWVPQRGELPNVVAPALLDGLERFGESFHTDIVHDIQSAGFDVDAVEVGDPPNVTLRVGSDLKMLQVAVRERGVDGLLPQSELSQGMWRSLCTIILLHYALRAERPSILLVDDIGEGLDYERASGLIQTIMRRVKDSQTQVVFTSNDRQVMNAVPLEAWHVLMRKGGKVTIYDQHNAAERFAEFKYTGLNNFDLLSSGFLEEGAGSADVELV